MAKLLFTLIVREFFSKRNFEWTFVAFKPWCHSENSKFLISCDIVDSIVNVKVRWFQELSIASEVLYTPLIRSVQTLLSSSRIVWCLIPDVMWPVVISFLAYFLSGFSGEPVRIKVALRTRNGLPNFSKETAFFQTLIVVSQLKIGLI